MSAAGRAIVAIAEVMDVSESDGAEAQSGTAERSVIRATKIGTVITSESKASGKKKTFSLKRIYTSCVWTG